MKFASMRRRLHVVMGTAIILCWATVLGTVLLVVTHDKSGFWDRQMEAVASKILLSMPDPSELSKMQAGSTLLQRPRQAMTPESVTFQVWVDRKHMAIRAPDAPSTPLRPDFIDGPMTIHSGGAPLRVFSVGDASSRIHVQVAEPTALLHEQILGDALWVLAGGTLILLALGWTIGIAVHRSLAPLLFLGKTLRQRSPLDLTPLSVDELPAELAPVVESFNHVLVQLDQSVEVERRFIADAAHELRTPLAAVLAQAQVALRADSAEEKARALARLVSVAERSTRLSEQMLDLARLNAGMHRAHDRIADLGGLALHVVHEFEVVARQRGCSLWLDVTECPICCDVDEVGIMIRNLIDNAMRHTGERGLVRIACHPRGARHVVLEVADNGPGVPVAEHEAIFRRFYRVAGSGERGSGIGLSLVAGIAALHGADIETGSGIDGTGLTVRIVFLRAEARSGGAPPLHHGRRFGDQKL
jgi:signal transduction histidine kinase